ncbi:MAG: PEP-CTERM sorting domain-containing protein [Cyanobacteriota bacterium]|nr:PEP-CTERM sorting domain-containing protein [Cyanobacteriota bacterium]
MILKHNLLKAFTSLSLGLGISLGTINAGQSVAATITYDFEVRNLTGSLSGNTYSGFFSYDDSLAANQMSGNGIETITSSGGGLSFNFDFMGIVYDETNDPYDRTQVTFNNGVADSIYFRGNYDTYPVSAPNTFAFTSTISSGLGVFTDVDFEYLIDSGLNAGGGIGDVFITRRPTRTPSLPDLYTEIGFIPKPPVTLETSITPASPLQKLAALKASKYEPTSVPEPFSIVGLGAIATGLLLKKRKGVKA